MRQSSLNAASTARLSLTLLFVVSVFNYTDRYMIAILLPDIKEEFALSDTEMGLLTGVAFSLFYVLMGIPIARLADRYSRKKILSWALGIWSLMTAACGLAQNFLQLLLARVLVGVGEAGASPPSYSLISDLYPAGRRAAAMAVYLAGGPAGVLIGFILGGLLTEMYGWRAALFIVGAPGLLFAFILMKTLHEPSRGGADGLIEQPPVVPIGRGLLELLRCATFRHVALGCAFYNALIVAYVNWLPSFFVRSHGAGLKEVGLSLAFTIGPSQFIGMIAGGALADRLSRVDIRWYVRLPCAAILCTTPIFMASLLVKGTGLALLCLFVPLLIGVMQTSPAFAITQSLVEVRMRAVASAVLILIINVISGGLGPVAVGMLSDLLAVTLGVESLRYALVILTPIFCIWAALHYMWAGRHIQADLKVKMLPKEKGTA